jgi:hypothetical protein
MLDQLASCSWTLITSCLSSLFIVLLPSQNIYIFIFYTLGMEYICGRIYVETCGKSLVLPRYYNWDIVKTWQASHGLTETHQKGHWKIMLYQGGGEKIDTLWERWKCANGKSDPEEQRKSSLSDCTWLERVLILHPVGVSSPWPIWSLLSHLHLYICLASYN